MKGIVYKGDKVAEIKDFPIPEPTGRQVLVKTKATTICGSDMRKWRSGKDDLLKRFGKEKMESFWFNLIQGHEGAGVVEAVGPSVDILKKGDRVMMVHSQGCGVCRNCIEGDPRLCTTIEPSTPPSPYPPYKKMGQWLQASNVNGTFSEYILNRNEHSVRKLDPFLSFMDGATMGCCSGTAFETLRKTNVNPRTKMVVYGLGPVGLTVTLLAKTLGAFVIGVDIREERIRLGEKHGCDVVINSKEEDAVKKIMELTNKKGLDVAIDASGFAAMEAIKSVSNNRGKICVVGLGDDSYKGVPEFNTRLLWERGIWGSSLFPLQSVHELMDLLVQHKIHLDTIVDTKYKLSQAQEAHEQFETYRSGKIGFIL